MDTLGGIGRVVCSTKIHLQNQYTTTILQIVRFLKNNILQYIAIWYQNVISHVDKLAIFEKIIFCNILQYAIDLWYHTFNTMWCFKIHVLQYIAICY